ncbi:MAG: glycosyltransferase family 39 protein [bacterium]|nr:glycosyltransferase family 39 protein [bacterium]
MAHTRSDSSLPADSELPLWMRRAVRGTDWGALFAIALSLIAAWSFLAQAYLPRTNDLERYVFRAASTADAMREGTLYPRWSADALQGYGAPIPHYMPPLPAYLPALIDALFINHPSLAVRLVCAAAFLVAGSAMYALVARRTNSSAGLLAAVLYVYSPTVGLIAPHMQGDVRLVILHGLIPSFLWAFDGALLLRRPLDVISLIALTSGIMLSDPVFLPLVLVAALPLLFASGIPIIRRRLWYAWGALLCGIGLTSFYWLPAVAEQEMVVWLVQAAQAAPMLVFPQIMLPFSFLDPNALLPRYYHTLGLPLVIAALIAMRWLNRQRLHTAYWLLGAGGLIVLIVVVPQRGDWLGVIILCLAFASSVLLADTVYIPATLRRVVLPFTILLILAGSAPVWLTPHGRASVLEFSSAARIAFERAGYGSALVPQTQPIPVPQSIAAWVANQQPNTTPSQSPFTILAGGGGSRIGTLLEHSHTQRFQVRTLNALTLQLITAWFPGWQIVDSTLNATLTQAPQGLLQVEIAPEQVGEFSIALGSTPMRTLGWWVSALSAAAALLFVAIQRTPSADHPDVLFPLLSPEQTRLMLITTLSIAAAVLLLALPQSPFPVQMRPGSDLDGSLALRARTDAGLEAIAYRIDRATFTPGQTLTFDVYWRTLRFLETNDSVRASLVDRATGARVVSTAPRYLGHYPTGRWPTHAHVLDRVTLPIPHTLNPADYALALEVFPCTPNERCTLETRRSFFAADGTPLGQLLILPVLITIEARVS